MTTSSHRSKYTIIGDILTCCLSPELFTHIMYKANLSFLMCSTYLKYMLDTNLLENVVNGEVGKLHYLITSKGRAALDHINQLQYLGIDNISVKKDSSVIVNEN